MQTGVASRERSLPIERAFGVLPSGDRVVGEFVLPFVQVIAEVSGLTVDIETQRGLQTHLVGNLKLLIRKTQDQRQAVAGIDDVLEITEGMPLRRMIMNGIR